MRISVFGLGYVGCVSAACLASRGNRVIGVDIAPEKVRMVAEGRTPVVEERIGELIAEQVGSGALRATDDVAVAMAESDIGIICVGTPSRPNGDLTTDHLAAAAGQIGAELARRPAGDRFTVVVRSTMLPGTCESVVIPAIEAASGLTAGPDFGVAVNPEFLREGSSVRDFFDPPKTVIGHLDTDSAELLRRLYEGLPGPVFTVPLRVAEMTKYVDNAFHALKVGFANEIGDICHALGLDSHRVMEIFTADTKLNISPAYLKPGFAFGGSCLPKDLRAIVHRAGRADVEVPILAGILPSNERQIERAFEAVLAAGVRTVGLFGLSFKPGTDDLRESPLVALAERLVGRGLELAIHDPHVGISRLMGANRAYVDQRIPHLGRLMVESAGEVAARSEVLVVASTRPDVVAAVAAAPRSATIIDLVRFPGSEAYEGSDRYTGVAW